MFKELYEKAQSCEADMVYSFMENEIMSKDIWFENFIADTKEYRVEVINQIIGIIAYRARRFKTPVCQYGEAYLGENLLIQGIYDSFLKGK